MIVAGHERITAVACAGWQVRFRLAPDKEGKEEAIHVTLIT
jgi:hypothetical protein